MAIGHIAVRSHTRSKGHSAAAAVAYRCATRVIDERTGELHDYSRRAVRGDVVESSLTAGPWSDAQAFATAIETAERRKNSMILRDVQPAIPSELGEADQVALTADFASQLAARYGTQALWAVHRPHARGDWRNGHAHIVLPTRRLNDAGDGFGKKLRELDCKPQSSVEVKAIRQLWETTANQYLTRAKSPSRVDCGRRHDGDPIPTLGPVATGLERRAQPDAPPQPVAELVTDSAEEPVTDAGRALAQVMLERQARGDERSRKKTTASRKKTTALPASRPPLPRPAFAPLRVPAPVPSVHRAQTRAAVVCTRPVPEQRIEDLQHQRDREQTPQTPPQAPVADLPAPSDLIAAAVASPGRLPGYRRAFAAADPRAGVRRLALDGADPELIDNTWRQQRREWIPAVRERKKAQAAAVDPQSPPQAAQRPPQAAHAKEPSFRPPKAAQEPSPSVAAPNPDRGGGRRPEHRHDGPSRSGPSR